MAASTVATSTINSFLMHYTGLTGTPTAADSAKAEKVVDIKSYPAFGGAPEKIETTTLSDSVQKFVTGVQSLDDFDFTANYVQKDYRKLKTLEALGEAEYWAVFFGADAKGNPDGHDGIVAWQGGVSSYISEGEVNGVREMHAVFSVQASPVLLEDAAAENPGA